MTKWLVLGVFLAVVAVAVALLAVGIALAVYFAGSRSGSSTSESSAAAPTSSPTPEATQAVSPTASPVASPSVSPTPAPAASPSVFPTSGAVTTQPASSTPTPVDRLPTPYPPMAVGAAGAPSCPDGWLPYDIAAASYAFCAPQGWHVIVGSFDAGTVGVRNTALSARLAQTWPKGGDVLPGEVSVWLDNEPKVSTLEKWAQSCDQFKVTVSGKEASGCVQYGDPIMGLPEEVITVSVWIDRGETILIVGATFWTSETAEANKETILQLARSIQLR